jgi:hypothetical protein
MPDKTPYRRRHHARVRARCPGLSTGRSAHAHPAGLLNGSNKASGGVWNRWGGVQGHGLRFNSSVAAGIRQAKGTESKHNGYEILSPTTIDSGPRARAEGDSCLSTEDILDRFASMLPKAMGFHPWPFLFQGSGT